MKQLQFVLILGMLLIASSALAQIPIFTSRWTTECVQDDFIVTVTIANSDPGLEFMVYRDLIFPDSGAERVNFTAEPVPAPDPGESLILSLNDPDINPDQGTDFVGRYVIEATWPGGSIVSVDHKWLSCGETYRLARGYLLEDNLIEPCTGIGLPECTVVELFYGDLQVHVGSNEMLDFFGRIVTYDGVDDCSLQIHAIDPQGVGTPCEIPVAVQETSWGGLKATYR